MSAPSMCTCKHHYSFHEQRITDPQPCTRTTCDCTAFVARDDLDTLVQVIS